MMWNGVRSRALLASALLILVGCPGGTEPVPTGSITGSVRDAASSALIDGAQVRVSPGGLSLTCDATGTFAFHRLVPGIYQITAVKQGYGVMQPVPVRVSSGQVADAQLLLSASVTRGRIAGLVRDAQAGTLVAGATLRADPGATVAVSAEDGSYALEELVPGTYTLAVEAEAYQPLTSEAVTVTAGSTSTLDLSISPAILYASTCEGCHLQLEMILASLADDPLPEDPGEGGSAGEG